LIYHLYVIRQYTFVKLKEVLCGGAIKEESLKGAYFKAFFKDFVDDFTLDSLLEGMRLDKAKSAVV